MFARTARAEVVNHCLECRKRRGAVGPDISARGFLLARREHLYWRFVSVDHALGKYHFAQRIDQGLELHTGLADRLRQCRAGDSQAGAAKDFLLPIQRQWSANLATIT